MNWDSYFLKICEAVSSKSPCMSRKIGAILVRENIVIATGFNGPARGVPHCGQERIIKDDLFDERTMNHLLNLYNVEEVNNTCPRKLLGFRSGEGLNQCPALHAEQNCLANASRIGASVNGSTLYMNSIIPCKTCFGLLTNAGIAEIVVESEVLYTNSVQYTFRASNVKIREFKLNENTNTRI